LIFLEKIDQKHLKTIKEIYKKTYKHEQSTVQSLPTYQSIEKKTNALIERLYSSHSGYVAIEQGHSVGYLFFMLGDEIFGKSKCAFVPLYGHGAIETNKMAIYQALLTKAAEDWVENNRLMWIVRTFEHDSLSRFWFKNGFGQRCADAIMTNEPKYVDNKIIIKKAKVEDLTDIKTLHAMHTLYYTKSPIFMPRNNEDPFKALNDWFNQSDRHLWIAYDGQTAVGYMRVEEDGESYISSIKEVVNVTSAFVDPHFQGKGVGKKLLSVVRTYLSKKDYTSIGVDYETINPLGCRFWEKHFTPYTKTLTRRINEHVLD
jgi:GNAT superfamily N-acetyltransferase